MPNWSSNTLEIIGKPVEITAVLDFIASKDESGNIICPFSFNKIIPMPRELNEIGEFAFSPEYYSEPQESWGEEHLKQWYQMKDNMEKYGFYTWKDWSTKNWGTKWPAGEISASENKVFYMTAWSPPIPIIEAISRAFPSIGFRSSSFIEGGGTEVDYFFIDGYPIYYQSIDVQGPLYWLETTGTKMDLMIDGKEGAKNIHDYYH